MATQTNNGTKVLLLLFFVNLLNYVDRQILYAVLPLIKLDLRLTDAQLGSLASVFILVYMCAAPLVAALEDRGGRVRWMSAGVFAWSIATFFSGFSKTFPGLLASRAAVGIGESSYGSMSPSFVAESFPEERRARVLAVFSVAIPVGSALGYIIGGTLGARFGWRQAFFFAGAVGLPFSFLVFRLEDPRRLSGANLAAASTKNYATLFRNKTFVLDTLAMAALTFVVGGLAVWLPTFLNRTWGVSVAKAGTIFGGITVLAGIGGGLAGGWITDWLRKKISTASFIVSAVGVLTSLPLGIAALYCQNLTAALVLIFFAELFLFLNTGPLNVVITDVTPLGLRTMAFAVNIFFIHALGDALSPILIGVISDKVGLRFALVVTMSVLAVAVGCCLLGIKHYEKDLSHES